MTDTTCNRRTWLQPFGSITLTGMALTPIAGINTHDTETTAEHVLLSTLVLGPQDTTPRVEARIRRFAKVQRERFHTQVSDT